MKLTDLIDPKAIVSEIQSTSKEDVIKELVEALAATGKIDPKDTKKLIAALMAREQLGSTGIGLGLAVPHAKHNSVGNLVAAFGRSKKGIDFDSLDGEPVYLVFLLLSNKEAAGPYLEALAYITKLLRDDLFCQFLKKAKDHDELVELLLKEADQKLAAQG
jgi:fructose-specific phosphotransferase system IIA component